MPPFAKSFRQNYDRYIPGMYDWLAGLIALWSLGLSCIESTVNQDAHHWGLMYVPAIGLKQGLIACKEVLIYYGVLTSAIQSMGLGIFGENFRALGITTGIFFSLSLLLQYQILKSFLSKNSACFAVLIIFLLHGYIIYPWSNYFAYTFELVAVAAIVQRGGAKRYLIAGFAIGAAILTRYSAVQSVLLPFILLLIYQVIRQRRRTAYLLKQYSLFTIGLLIPLVTFTGYLIVNHGLDSFILHNLLTLQAMVAKGTPDFNGGSENFLINILSGKVLYIKGLFIERDSRSIFLSLLLALDLLVFGTIMGRAIAHRHPARPTQSTSAADREERILLISAVSLCGYLNGLNLYEVFRIANGSAIGIGLIFYYLERGRTALRIKPYWIGLVITSLSILALHWSNSLMFTKTTSVLNPWTFLSSPADMVTSANVPVLAGKLVTRSFNDRYSRLRAAIHPLNPNWALINYTPDTISVLVDQNRPRLQKSPAYFLPVQAGLTDEVARMQQAIAAKQAIVLAPLNTPAPAGYRQHAAIDAISVFIPE
jgi:4-amino-4-deoxy-L-arabinose transferase-like glycosyltransferase